MPLPDVLQAKTVFEFGITVATSNTRRVLDVLVVGS